MVDDYTITVRLRGHEARRALEQAAAALEDLEAAIEPSGGGASDGSQHAKPGSKPPPGNTRAAGQLAYATQLLVRVAEVRDRLYTELDHAHYRRTTGREHRDVTLAKELRRVVRRAKAQGMGEPREEGEG